MFRNWRLSQQLLCIYYKFQSHVALTLHLYRFTLVYLCHLLVLLLVFNGSIFLNDMLASCEISVDVHHSQIVLEDMLNLGCLMNGIYDLD